MDRLGNIRRVGRFLLSAAPLFLFLFAIFNAPEWTPAQTNLSQDVTVTSMGRRANNATKTFTLASGSAKDSSQSFNPWTYTGLVMKAHQANDSCDVDVTIWVGYNGILEEGDSFTISDTGSVVTQLLLPISRVAFIVFSRGSSAGTNITIDSLYTLRQW